MSVRSILDSEKAIGTLLAGAQCNEDRSFRLSHLAEV